MAVEAGTGSGLWHIKPEEGQTQTSPVIGGDLIIELLPFGWISAFQIGDGAEKWRVDVGKGSSSDASPVLAGDRIYGGLADDQLYFALDAADGRVIWQFKTQYLATYVPAVADGVVVAASEDISSSNMLFYGVSAEDGKELWRLDQREVASSASILGSMAIFGGGDFFAHAVDLKTGREIWKSPVEGKFGPKNFPAIAFGDVFLADRIGNIYRLDGQTGRRKWMLSDDHTEGTMDQSFPVVAGRTLFIGSSAGGLYAVDTETGKLLWKDQVRGIVLSGAADAERFYFGVKLGADEGLYAYEHDPNGELLTDGGVPRSFVALIRGIVLFGLALIAIIWFARRRRAKNASSS